MRARSWLAAGVLVVAAVGGSAADARAGSGTCDVFQGRISTDWFTAGNWSLRHVPSASDDVCLPNKQDPVIDSDTQTAEAGTLTVSNPGMFSASTPIDVAGDVVLLSHATVSTENMTAEGVISPPGRGHTGRGQTKIILGDNTNIGSDGIQVSGLFVALGTTDVTVGGQGVNLSGERNNNRYTGSGHFCGTNLVNVVVSGDINYFPPSCNGGTIRLLSLEVQDGGKYSTAVGTKLEVDGAVTLDSGSVLRFYGPRPTGTGTLISGGSVDGQFSAVVNDPPSAISYTTTQVNFARTAS